VVQQLLAARPALALAVRQLSSASRPHPGGQTATGSEMDDATGAASSGDMVRCIALRLFDVAAGSDGHTASRYSRDAQVHGDGCSAVYLACMFLMLSDQV
jgi:hypothetical protein